MADLVTSARGQAHITPKNDAVIHRGMMGVESCILDYGEKLAPALVPSQPTNIRILDGCGMMQGRFFEIEEGSYDTIAIPNGAQGYNRIDIVCAKITQNENGTQTFSWEVVQGTQTEGTPTPPTVEEHSLDDGDEFALMPIASVELEGVNIVAVETVATIGRTINDGMMLIPDGAAAHNAIYRGKYLGTAVTDEQYARIQDGTFHDLFIGDYWTIGGINWRIADFDYWYGMGDTECTTHHAVIVPDTELYKAQMNTSNVVTGAYVGSRMYTTNLATAKTTINNAFGSAHILSHREYLQNEVPTNGAYASSAAWLDSTVELMGEEMVYGSRAYKNIMHGANSASMATVENSQLNLFRHDHSRIINRDGNGNRSHWWLRDVASSTNFAIVYSRGVSSIGYASSSFGVRPAFGIC